MSMIRLLSSCVRVAAIASVGLMLGACSHPGYVELSELCGTEGRNGSWSLISVSKDDRLTKGTAKDILGNNVAHKAICKES